MCIQRSFKSLGIAVALATVACGCAHKGPTANEKLNQWLARREIQMPPAPYHVQPPDTIQISSSNIKELNGQKQTVRSDGRISLNLIGEIDVAGKTPEEIARDIRTRAASFYDRRLIDISVQVVEFKSRVVYVFGQVRVPGIIPFTGRETVVNVLAAAQLNDRAWPQKVIVVRPNEDPSIHQKVTVDLKRMYESGDTSNDYLLENGDIIYVPPSPMAQLGTNVARVTVPLQPVLNLATLATFGGI